VKARERAAGSAEDGGGITAARDQLEKGLDLVLFDTAALAGEAAELSNLALDDTAEPKTVLGKRAGILVGM
jgi:hypothetical protein